VVEGSLQCDYPLFIPHAVSRDLVGLEGFHSSQSHPLIKPASIDETSDGNRFMVALEEDALTLFALFDQPVDGFARGRPSIDVITQENANRPRGRTPADICFNLGE